MYIKFNSEKRTHRIMVWVSDEEKTLVETKADYYNYKKVAPYIRDAAIYEKITKVDVKNADKICNAYEENTKEIKKITREIRNLIKYFTNNLDKVELQEIKSLMLNVIKNQKAMLTLIDNKLDLDVWQKINHDKTMEDK